MATVFSINVPVTTTANFVDVQNNLTVGTHTFTLVVVDEQGNRSGPARAQVAVRRLTITLPTTDPGPLIG